MYRWLAQLFANISVNRKLSLGFGLVLVLTVLIAATGWKGLAAMIDRGDKLAHISTIIDLSKDLRIARMTYETTPDNSTQRDVMQQLSALDSVLEVTRKQLTQPEDLALIEQQLNAVQAYRQAFTERLQPAQAGADAMENIHQQGNHLIELSQKLSALQIARRDSDSRQARTLLAGCTLLALVVGLIAAWLITRQIVTPRHVDHYRLWSKG